MPPISGLRQAFGRSGALRQSRSSVCLFCSFTKHAGPSSLVPRRKPLGGSARRESTDTAATPTTTFSDPRRDLQDALLDLQTHAPNHVNLARVQLALRNLSQTPGYESIRVAFLGLKNGSNSGPTAKKLLKLALADPLNPPGEWEAQLEDHDLSQPLIVRVGAVEEHSEEKLEVAKGHSIPEIKVSSPPLNAGDLEMLLMEAGELAAAEHTGDALAVDDAILAPTVEISVSPKGILTPIATPVHMALLVGDGVLGAASVLSIPVLEGSDTITAAVNFKRLDADDLTGCPIVKVNLEAGEEGLELFRRDVGNAMKYQALWSESNVGRIGDWLRENVLPTENDATKTPVRNLIQSLLQNTSAKIQADETRGLFKAVAGDIPPDAVARLNQGLTEWAQNAHEELQERLEVAFASRAWRKLGWWKLFWRADDVGMLSSEMLSLQFLPGAEKSIIYLAGRVQEAGIAEGHTNHPLYSSPPPTTHSTAVVTQSEVKWPTHISFTRNYLQEKTVPALQALAQKLVLQSTGSTALTTALAGLTYLSAFGAYESGAIAALGLVWSLRRLQQKWETARDFWEGEVREEGRKAIRATEASIAQVLERASKSRSSEVEALDELRKAREIIQRAEDALARLP
ncbi:hypothetical protein B0T16DRAFT_387070 [Cercophora newfieldiana]|uniref:Mmc1 C-terminal domain-containing protein n=1 Tax=Cercophora newfieldiana TaxID=92897 RepID=A0AA40CWF0_9PEZI|nr:hypothetical protein B0T16DRAFT_387070 [Cercophora newfieldiana]